MSFPRDLFKEILSDLGIEVSPEELEDSIQRAEALLARESVITKEVTN